MYIRDGRRFVKASLQTQFKQNDMRGQYYNEDGTFSITRKQNSIGLCIIQNPTEYVICSLCDLNEDYDHELAENIVNYSFAGKGRLPTLSELTIAFQEYNRILKFELYSVYWTRTFNSVGDDDGWSDYGCFLCGLAGSYRAAAGLGDRLCQCKVRPFLSIPIKY